MSRTDDEHQSRSAEGSGVDAGSRRAALKAAARKSSRPRLSETSRNEAVRPEPCVKADPQPGLVRVQPTDTATVPDVFISYSSDDRAIVRELRDYLVSRGLTVWWDLDIASGSNFRGVIDQNLDNAKAVVVLWSGKSVKSEFVLDEANEARDQNKLVTAHVSGMTPRQFPIGFRQRQTYCVDDRERLVAALAALGVTPPGDVTTAI